METYPLRSEHVGYGCIGTLARVSSSIYASVPDVHINQAQSVLLGLQDGKLGHAVVEKRTVGDDSTIFS